MTGPSTGIGIGNGRSRGQLKPSLGDGTWLATGSYGLWWEKSI